MRSVNDPPKRLRTRISQAHWCDPATTDFEKATISSVMRGNLNYGTCWLDELFEGGIVLPETGEGGKKALTMLLSGPPGTGKTTFAMELCCRLAESPRRTNEQSLDEVKRPLKSLYLTTESHKDWMMQNVRSFGWPSVRHVGQTEQFRVRIVDLEDIEREVGDSLGTPTLENTLSSQDSFKTPEDAVAELEREGIGDVLSRLFKGVQRRPRRAPDASIVRTRSRQNTRLPLPNTTNIDVVVIDSLNTIEMDKATAYRDFMQLTTRNLLK
jgi:predicted ATP-dependent serine protease